MSKTIKRVKNHLIKNGSITDREARESCGTSRVAVYINLLRNSGLKIRTVYISTTNQFNERCRYGKYLLIDQETGL